MYIVCNQNTEKSYTFSSDRILKFKVQKVTNSDLWNLIVILDGKNEECSTVYLGRYNHPHRYIKQLITIIQHSAPNFIYNCISNEDEMEQYLPKEIEPQEKFKLQETAVTLSGDSIKPTPSKGMETLRKSFKLEFVNLTGKVISAGKIQEFLFTELLKTIGNNFASHDIVIDLIPWSELQYAMTLCKEAFEDQFDLNMEYQGEFHEIEHNSGLVKYLGSETGVYPIKVIAYNRENIKTGNSEDDPCLGCKYQNVYGNNSFICRLCSVTSCTGLLDDMNLYTPEEKACTCTTCKYRHESIDSDTCKGCLEEYRTKTVLNEYMKPEEFPTFNDCIKKLRATGAIEISELKTFPFVDDTCKVPPLPYLNYKKDSKNFHIMRNSTLFQYTWGIERVLRNWDYPTDTAAEQVAMFPVVTKRNVETSSRSIRSQLSLEYMKHKMTSTLDDIAFKFCKYCTDEDNCKRVSDGDWCSVLNFAFGEQTFQYETLGFVHKSKHGSRETCINCIYASNAPNQFPCCVCKHLVAEDTVSGLRHGGTLDMKLSKELGQSGKIFKFNGEEVFPKSPFSYYVIDEYNKNK